MKTRPIATVLAISAGLIVLSGYFIPALDLIRIEMIQWAVVAGAAAALVGIGNLFTVHFQKARRREKDSFYSLVLLVSMLGTLLIGMFSLLFDRSLAWLQPAVDAIILPVEASLMALLAVTLLYASIRLLRRRPDWMSALFLLSAISIIGATAILPLFLRDIGDVILSWMSLLLAGGGSRGLLMGVALGALITGLRVIFGMDRPYGGK